MDGIVVVDVEVDGTVTVVVEVEGKDVWAAPVDVVSRKIIQKTPKINFTQNNNLKMCWFEISKPEVIKTVF